MPWQTLGAVDPKQLAKARAQAHWGVQVVSAAGETFLPPVPDTSHTAATWDAAHAALVGAPLPGAAPVRLALRVADLTLLVLGKSGAPQAELALTGRTLDEARRWAARAVRDCGGGALDRELVHPGYELLPHPIERGGRFTGDPGLSELARWYANADAALREVAAATPGAGPVLCWPHHFDIAMLVELERDAEGEAVRTVGVGFSPGDDFADEPYAYVNHGPETERAELPPLSAGEWFREGWTGAVLRGTRLVASGDAAAQQAQLRAFFGVAVPASIALAREGRLD